VLLSDSEVQFNSLQYSSVQFCEFVLPTLFSKCDYMMQ